MELLRIENVSKIYQTRLGLQQCRALNGLSFSVEQGDFTAIMGASGSGKTTLLNILATLDQPSGGEVYLDGRAFSSVKGGERSLFRRDNLGFVFQDFTLLDTFSLRDNILLPLMLARRPLAEMEARLEPVAEMLGLTPLLNKFPYEVSGGEKQRTAVARAVITEPRVILADEPTGALDSRASQNLLDIFRRLNEGGKTILMVTHSSFAASYAQRVLYLRDGLIANQLQRTAGENSRAFFERIVNQLSLVLDGGADLG